MQGLCPSPGSCKNTDGSFKCVCPRGFQLDNTGTFCVDQTDCSGSRCESGCRNGGGGGGSYECGCPEGFELHLYYNQCVDKNECEEAVNPCGDSKCTNTIGSYECGCPTGYRYEQSMNVCVQVAGGCEGAPCAFGCSPTGPQGYSCQCPRGYQSIGDGHCVATVNPSSYQALSRDWNFQDYEEGRDDFISTEGCFSCQMNGGSRRKSKRRRYKRSKKEVFFNLIADKSALQHDFKISLAVSAEQTKDRRRILMLQPSRLDLAKSVDYNLTEDPSGLLAIHRRDGVWGLFFRQPPPVNQTNILAIIKGDPQKGPDFSDRYINTLVNITVN